MTTSFRSSFNLNVTIVENFAFKLLKIEDRRDSSRSTKFKMKSPVIIRANISKSNF